MNLESPLKFLRMSDLEEKIGLRRSSIYNLMNPKSKYFDPTFPKPVKLTDNGRSKRWCRLEVEAWMLSRLETR